MQLKPGLQSDGSWFVPVMPVRKDQSIPSKNSKFGRCRNPAYREAQKAFRSYLIGFPDPLPRIYAKSGTKKRAAVLDLPNVRLDMTLYAEGTSRMDTVTAYDFLNDVLEGIGYKDDWQVWGGFIQKRPHSGISGVQFKLTEISQGEVLGRVL